jgi:hypothetical protein
LNQNPFFDIDDSPSGQPFNQFSPGPGGFSGGPGGFPGGPGGFPGGPGGFPGGPGGFPGGPGGFPGGPGGFPGGPGGFPGGPGGFPGGPGGFPGGPGSNTPMPMGPPPTFTPSMSVTTQAAGTSGIRRCLYRNTFIWQINGNSFWFFPIFVTQNSVLGFRWGRFGWVYSTINRNSILTFQCF